MLKAFGPSCKHKPGQIKSSQPNPNNYLRDNTGEEVDHKMAWFVRTIMLSSKTAIGSAKLKRLVFSEVAELVLPYWRFKSQLDQD